MNVHPKSTYQFLLAKGKCQSCHAALMKNQSYIMCFYCKQVAYCDAECCKQDQELHEEICPSHISQDKDLAHCDTSELRWTYGCGPPENRASQRKKIFAAILWHGLDVKVTTFRACEMSQKLLFL
jgi:hypothetical protein